MNFDPNVKDDRYPRVTYRSPEFIEVPIAEAEAVLLAAIAAYRIAASDLADARHHYANYGVGESTVELCESNLVKAEARIMTAARKLGEAMRDGQYCACAGHVHNRQRFAKLGLMCLDCGGRVREG